MPNAKRVTITGVSWPAGSRGESNDRNDDRKQRRRAEEVEREGKRYA
jgi:hypothetical protein